MVVGLRRWWTRHQHVGAGTKLAARVAEGVAQHALDAVAADRMRIDLARHRQSQPRWGAVVQPVQREQRLGGAAAGFEHAVELDLRAHPCRPRE